MCRLLHSFLALVIAFSYAAGSRVVVGMEHCHDTHGSDHQVQTEPVHDCHSHVGDHDHSHDHAPDSPSDSEPDEGGHGSEHHHHFHVIAMGLDAPVGNAASGLIRGAPWTTLRSFLPDGESAPDGPSFDLIKPPQLG
ncbi:hypothetical protein HAHE_23580 [Haloferula helveola]|uniref:Cobalt transporter n=2 Tax=Haloferula helveola TaxID=490095 RepID=A0ABN6H469_9BACT|nr:hypothetical protein HAHE_23580 [Haloferula helveola]